MSDSTPNTADSTGAPKTRRKLTMTQADWDRVERAVRRGEHEPDPQQETFLPVLLPEEGRRQQRRNHA